MNKKPISGRGRGRGNPGRSSGRSQGRGRGRKKDIVFTAPVGKAGKNFFQPFGIDTKLPTNKRNSDQRSPFEGGKQLKKPAPFFSIQTDFDEIPPTQPPTPEATRALLAKTLKTSTATTTTPNSTDTNTVASSQHTKFHKSPSNIPSSETTHQNNEISHDSKSTGPQETSSSNEDSHISSDSDYISNETNSSNDEDSFHSMDAESIQDVEDNEVTDLQNDRVLHGDDKEPEGFISAETETRIQKRREKKAKARAQQNRPSEPPINEDSNSPNNFDSTANTTPRNEVIVVDESLSTEPSTPHDNANQKTSALSTTSIQSSTTYKVVNDCSRNRRISNAKSSTVYA